METKAITFEKVEGRIGVYFVLSENEHVGLVRRVEHWTVRGTRIVWQAQRRGRVFGSAETRKEAAELLTA